MENTNNQTTLQKIEHNNIAWIDVERPDDKMLKYLEDTYHLHPIHLQESVQKVQHNHVEREESYLFLVMHYPVYMQNTDKIMFGQVGIFLSENFVVTIRSCESVSINGLYDESTNKAEFFEKGSSHLLFLIISYMLEELSYMTDTVVSELDELEDVVFNNNASNAQRIGRVRQKIVRLMRLIGPKRIILQDLTEQISSFSGHEMAKLFAKNGKATNKLWEVIEEAKETVEIYKDADFTTSSERTNETLAVLTVIFTLTIPITVVGTMFGMNVPLPGGIDVGAWTFLGRYTTLIVILILSVLMALSMYAYFKRKKWF